MSHPTDDTMDHSAASVTFISDESASGSVASAASFPTMPHLVDTHIHTSEDGVVIQIEPLHPETAESASARAVNSSSSSSPIATTNPKGKLARAIAGKEILASRVDALGETAPAASIDDSSDSGAVTPLVHTSIEPSVEGFAVQIEMQGINIAAANPPPVEEEPAGSVRIHISSESHADDHDAAGKRQSNIQSIPLFTSPPPTAARSPPPINLITIINVPTSPGHVVVPVGGNNKPIGTMNTTITNTTTTTTTTVNTTLNATLTTTTKPTKKYWKLLPQEIHTHIGTFLDARSLTKLSCVSSLSNTISSRKELWNPLINQGNWNGFSLIPNAEVIRGVSKLTGGKSYYQARYEWACSKRLERLREYQEKRVNVGRSHRAYCCHWWEGVWMNCLLSVLATLFLIFLVYQLQTDEGNERVNYFTFWTLLAIGFVLLCSCCLLCCKKWVCNSSGVLPENYYDNSKAPVKDIMEMVGEGNSFWSHLSFWFFSAGGPLTFIVFLSLKIGGYIDWHWSFVFLPLYVSFFLTCLSPCFKWSEPDDDLKDRIIPCGLVWIVLLAPILVFVILLNIRLEDTSSMGLTLVFIPLFALDLVSLVLLLWYVYDDDEPLGWAMLVWLVTVGPLIVFKILLAVKIDTDWQTLSYAVVFIPLYVTQLLICLAGIYFTIGQRDSLRWEIEWDDEPNKPNDPIPDV